MKNKEELPVLLRAYKLGKVDEEYAVEYITDMYCKENNFNEISFGLGGLLVAIIMAVLSTLGIM